MADLVSPDVFPAARRHAYLNAASVALMPRMAADAILDWQRDLATEGTVHFDEEAEEKVFDTLRQAAARLLGAEPLEIACVSSASEALCSLAWALSPGPDRNVVSARVDHPTTVYPWLRVARLTGCDVRLASDQDNLIDPSELVGLIDDRTSVVCVSHVQYSTGQRLDLAGLAQVAHSHGAILVVDASQSVGGVPINVAAEGVSTYDECYLYGADTPLGPWTPHPGNPIKSDVRSSRPAGRMIRWEGGLYRPTQDCSRRYGHAVAVQKVLELTPHTYRE